MMGREGGRETYDAMRFDSSHCDLTFVHPRRFFFLIFAKIEVKKTKFYTRKIDPMIACQIEDSELMDLLE